VEHTFSWGLPDPPRVVEKVLIRRRANQENISWTEAEKQVGRERDFNLWTEAMAAVEDETARMKDPVPLVLELPAVGDRLCPWSHCDCPRGLVVGVSLQFPKYASIGAPFLQNVYNL
jgi:hypothetical protein